MTVGMNFYTKYVATCLPECFFIFVFVSLCLLCAVLCSALLFDARFSVLCSLGSLETTYFEHEVLTQIRCDVSSRMLLCRVSRIANVGMCTHNFNERGGTTANKVVCKSPVRRDRHLFVSSQRLIYRLRHAHALRGNGAAQG